MSMEAWRISDRVSTGRRDLHRRPAQGRNVELPGEPSSPGNSTLPRTRYWLIATPLKALTPTEAEVAAGVRSP
jgi:hypothetical protein